MALVLIAIISLGITPAFADHGVNGHEVLPSGGREISPYAVMSSAPPAAMRIPHSRESGWV